MSTLVHPNVDDLIVGFDGRVRPPLRMTEEEFESWGAGVRAEWVDGEVIVMSPSSLIHVRLTTWLMSLLNLFVNGRELGEVLGPDFAVRFAGQRRRRIPDLLVLSRERASLLRPTLLEGAPDLAIEIVSPDSQSRDRRDKFAEYERAGVREYWIIDPLSRTVEAYALDANGRYQLIDAADDGRISSAVLPRFYLRPEWLWQEPLPNVVEALKELGIQF